MTPIGECGLVVILWPLRLAPQVWPYRLDCLAKLKESLMSFLFGVVIGLVVGWNFLAQPAFVSDAIAKLKAKFGG